MVVVGVCMSGRLGAWCSVHRIHLVIASMCIFCKHKEVSKC